MLIQQEEHPRVNAPHAHLFNPGKRTLLSVMNPLENALSLLNLTLGDSGRVAYRWNLRDRSFSWSDNVTHVLPFAGVGGFETESALFSAVHSEDRDRFLSLSEKLHAAPQAFEWEYRLSAADGMIYQVRHMGSPSETSADADYVIGMIDAKPVQTSPMPVEEKVVAPTAAAKPAFIASAHHYPESFIARLETAIAGCNAAGTSGVLMIVSITNLPMIITAYGRDVAETVLNNIHEQLYEMIAAGDTVERIHRDEFGIILPSCSKEEAAQVAFKINSLIQSYGATSTVGSVHVTATIGSVDFPHSAATALDALDNVYIAASNAQGMAYRSFETTKEETLLCRQQLGLANYLGKAIHTNRLRLAYQPIIESRSGKITHYEALLRLIGDDGKISSAGALIPIAERMGLIDIVDHLVLDMVAKELLASPQLTLSFNVSNLTTDNSDWIAHFGNILKEHPEIASRMIVEITETAAQRDLRSTAYFVASIQQHGARVALDDFGSGYTSFRQLKALSVDMVKIDGAFIRDLVDNTDNRFFVKTLLDFTNGFGLEAVAEFVENGETAKMLMDLGVHFMQGYYFGRPENFRSWLNSGEYERE